MNGCERGERNTGLPALLKFEGRKEGRVAIDKPALLLQCLRNATHSLIA